MLDIVAEIGMKSSRYWSRISLLLGALGIASAVGIGTRVQAAWACGTETYETRGVVKSIDAEHKIVHIAHERIGGLLAKKTSSFEARSSEQLRSIGRDDLVRVRFDATEDGRRVLDLIEKIPRR